MFNCAVLVVSVLSFAAAASTVDIGDYNISQPLDYDISSQLPKDLFEKDSIEDLVKNNLKESLNPPPVEDIGRQVAGNLDQISDITSDLDQINREFGKNIDNFSENVDETVQKAMADANATITQLGNDAFDRVERKLDDISTWFEENLPLIIVIAVGIFIFTLICYLCYFCCIFIVCPSACCFGVRTLCRNFCCCCCDVCCRESIRSSRHKGGIAVTQSSGCAGCKGYHLV